MPLLQPPASDLRPLQLTYTDGYNSIVSRVRRKAGSGSGGVVVLVGTDVDGLLASRILATLFRQDDVPYRLVPIGGYAELQAKRDEVLASEELHTLLLLSLGSLLNLADYFELPPNCHLHIIDAHRPWNLDNLFGLNVDVDPNAEANSSTEGTLWVWGDGEEAGLDGVKKSWEALEYEPSDSEDDSDEEDDGDESEEEAEEDAEDEEEEEEGESDEENQIGEGRIRKRRREGSAGPKKKRRHDDGDDDGRPRKLPRAVRDAHIERVNKYYHSGTHYGASVAFTVYLLATVLERADNDLLWLAILAVTYQYTAAQIDRTKYEDQHDLLLDEVVRLNPEVTGGAPNADDQRIAKHDELRFVLFRHWNLYDAMLHSSYVAGRLGIWKERGRKRLQGLLAKMGFSLQQCQQAYAHMDISLKRDLPYKLDSIAPEYGLVELQYPSFVRAYGFHMTNLSAADAVEGLEALLEAAKGIRMEVEVEGGKGGGEWFGGTRTWSVTNYSNGDVAPAEELETVKAEGQETKHQWHVQNFWTAYDACDDAALLRKSLTLAKSLHRAIIRQGSAILDKAVIRPLRTFRFAAVREGPDLKVFCHPSTLSRLALWLVDATRDRWNDRDARAGHKTNANPFVVACLDEDRGTYVVVGVTAAKEYGDVRKNRFGLAFQRAAEESGAASRHDSFDTSVVEMPEADLKGFIESLHLHSA